MVLGVLLYNAALFVVFCVLLLNHPTMPRRDQLAWMLCLLFTIPLISLVMLYFAFWYEYPATDDDDANKSRSTGMPNEEPNGAADLR